MNDLAFHISDLAENSLRAGADEIRISLHADERRLELRVEDNGCGMDAEAVRRASDPFYTTRTTRPVGLGLPFLFQSAELCGGRVELWSQKGVGTRVVAFFNSGHIDCPPSGDLGGTLAGLICSNPSVRIGVSLHSGAGRFEISTPEILAHLDNIPAGHPKVMLALTELLNSNICRIF